jgi:hypothetical protein
VQHADGYWILSEVQRLHRQVSRSLAVGLQRMQTGNDCCSGTNAERSADVFVFSSIEENKGASCIHNLNKYATYGFRLQSCCYLVLSYRFKSFLTSRLRRVESFGRRSRWSVSGGESGCGDWTRKHSEPGHLDWILTAGPRSQEGGSGSEFCTPANSRQGFGVSSSHAETVRRFLLLNERTSHVSA